MSPPRRGVHLDPVEGVPRIAAGDDLASVIDTALRTAGMTLEEGDVVSVASKLVSRAEGRFVDLTTVEPTASAKHLAGLIHKDPALVELVLQESTAVSRMAPGVLIVRSRLGIVSANAGIDLSNSRPIDAPEGSGPWALLLPNDPDAAARALAGRLREAWGLERLGVIVTDSLGRPFRIGTVGAALGVAGVPALWDQRGRHDLDGRELLHTCTALADQLAAAADMVAGQADEGLGVVRIRGIDWPDQAGTTARDLLRADDKDLYA